MKGEKAMINIVDGCIALVEGRENDFVATMIGAETPVCEDSINAKMLVEGFAKSFPQSFVEAVGVYLHDCVEVA